MGEEGCEGPLQDSRVNAGPPASLLVGVAGYRRTTYELWPEWGWLASYVD